MQSDIHEEISEEYEFLTRYARHLTTSTADADDLVQQCCERALRKSHQYRRNSNARSWLARILKNAHIDNLRAADRRATDMAYLEDTRCSGSAGNQIHRLQLREVGARISKLDEDEQQLLQRVVGQGHSYLSVASDLNIAVGTVKSRVSRIREKLSTRII